MTLTDRFIVVVWEEVEEHPLRIRPITAYEPTGDESSRQLTADIKMARIHRKTERTPEQLAEIKAVRERFQREKPSPAKLVESGEYYPPIPTSLYFELRVLAKRLRDAREAAGLSLAEMAGRTGMDKAFLSRLENGQGNPTVDTLARYAAALGKRVVFGLDNLADERERPIPEPTGT
ncbi:MAG TPA: helix-turn-helix transcriptional regulator [Gemmataceae bacterium]|nr:helix-turn-helix transcriptional regulator [Gemmataceae bacterium]